MRQDDDAARLPDFRRLPSRVSRDEMVETQAVTPSPELVPEPAEETTTGDWWLGGVR